MKISRIRNIGILSAIIVILLANSCLASAQPLQDPKSNGLLFNLQFVMNITWGNETDQPIQPGETREVSITVTTTVTRGATGRILLYLLTDRVYPIQLSITDTPEWCTAHFTIDHLYGVVKSDQMIILESTLLIQVSQDAPTNYSVGFVEFHSVIDNMKGPFNILTLIHGYENTCTIAFITGP